MIDSFARRCGVAMAFAASVTLAACGGGGGGGGNDSTPPAQVTLSSTTLSASYPSNTGALNAPSSTVTATIANAPSAQVYVVVQDSGSVMHGSAAIFENQDGSWSATVYYEQSLAPGTYKGTFQLKLCKDQACTGTYPVSGGTVSYTVTVTPTATFTATVNGVPTPLQTNNMPGFSDRPLTLALKAGDVVSIAASQPVSWGYSTSGAFASNVTQTTTTWTGTMQYGTSTPGQTGVIDLTASYLPDQQFSSALALGVTQ